jgi:hypothetical protein
VILISRHPEPAAEENLSILGYVVIVTTPAGHWHLTNADLMDLETAEHEAKQCRKAAIEKGSGRRFQVRPVYGEEQQR